MTKLLDCTLRDGGYYNDWNFPIEIARRTVSSLSAAGVDIIEVGLKSAKDSQCSGLFKYCNEDYLGFLNDYPDTEFSFMLNVKEFIKDGELDRKGLEEIIRPADKSVFHICRLASHYADFGLIDKFYAFFHDLGYKVGINLMGISLLSDEQIQSAMQSVNEIQPDVFYVADSFGSMLPEDVSSLVKTLRKSYQGEIGIHTHDNQGLAFANTLRAIDEGITYIDSTLTGMGRGAGNLSTEQILLWLQNRARAPERYHSSRVLEIIHDFFEPLKAECKWGFNYVYMLSGLNNIHPVYCMELCDGNKFSMSQITTILESIPKERRSGFSAIALSDSINNAPRIIDSTENSRILPPMPMEKYQSNGNACLIVAPGPGVKEYEFAINGLLERREWQVIECNDTGILSASSNRLGVVLNQMRLAEIAGKPKDQPNTIVTGENSTTHAIESKLFHFEYQIGEVKFEEQSIHIPEFEAGQYAISLAIKLGYRKIYLAGFSGYQDLDRNAGMESYFTEVCEQISELNLKAITPTFYQQVAQQSILYTIGGSRL